MKLVEYVREGAWPTVAGYGLYVAFLTAGYYYNVTFVQLGLLDLGTRHVGLTRTGVSVWLAVLAVVAFTVAVATGWTLDRRGWSRSLTVKLRVLFAVVVVQLLLTAVAPFVRTVPAFGAWVVCASAVMGVGFPTTFALAVHLIPVRDRGYVAAAATAATYFLANVLPVPWTVESFAVVTAAAMVPGVVVLGVLAFRPGLFADRVAGQIETFGVGRFCRPTPVQTRSLAFWFPVVLVFGVFFVDSLGFLRIVETPALLAAAWQSPQWTTRLWIGIVHVVAAVAGGVLYTSLDRRWLFLLIFGVFSFTHLLYVFELQVAALFPALADGPSVLTPLVYATAVSLYTTLTFALWPDLSTPDSVGLHSALGVGFAGFFATFLSTAVALVLDDMEVGLLSHLRIVNAVALLLFVGLVVALYTQGLWAALREVDRG